MDTLYFGQSADKHRATIKRKYLGYNFFERENTIVPSAMMKYVENNPITEKVCNRDVSKYNFLDHKEFATTLEIFSCILALVLLLCCMATVFMINVIIYNPISPAASALGRQVVTGVLAGLQLLFVTGAIASYCLMIWSWRGFRWIQSYLIDGAIQVDFLRHVTDIDKHQADALVSQREHLLSQVKAAVVRAFYVMHTSAMTGMTRCRISFEINPKNVAALLRHFSLDLDQHIESLLNKSNLDAFGQLRDSSEVYFRRGVQAKEVLIEELA